MKYTVAKISEGFKPFDVTITFETEKEVNLFTDMMTRDCTIPESVMNLEEPDACIVKKMMQALCDAAIEGNRAAQR
jgi:hypothetical protein